MDSAAQRPTGSRQPGSRQPAKDRDALLARALGAVSDDHGARLAVAVLDRDSGRGATCGAGAFDTASIVKVDILAALLLQAQDAGRHLSAREESYAAAMIEDSDNDSASALWAVIGREEGLDRANRRFGLTDTAGGGEGLWGLTRTTAADQLVLLGQVFGRDSLLSDASRAYLRGLMSAVRADQRWGVSAAADAGAGWALKNGWLPRGTTGLWVVNSVGAITAGGHDLLVAVLSSGNPTMGEGVSRVEAAARAAVSVCG
ncbi:serine hydrolase [Streptomyces sp. NPDC048664]|uniref:serine hydrolase n=1 Tax=Streptomyces sp. NPDC048664 TaxID=3154505 RepID=UPI003434F822